MARRRYIAITVVLVVLVGLLIGPFLVPVPPLSNTVAPRALADPDSRFIEIRGIDIHFKMAGAGPRTVLLLHGFGASVWSWRDVITPLAMGYRVIAYDRPAFGLTERPLQWSGENPYAAATQVDIALDLLDALGVERAILIGHSAGGRVAADIALAAPARIEALVLVSPAVGMRGWRWLTPLLHTPQLDRLGPLLVRSISNSGDAVIEQAWHQPERITARIIAGYRKPLDADNWDRALWEFTRAPRGDDSITALAALAGTPTLIITGDDDRIVPTAASIELAEVIPGATLDVLDSCGHLPQEECPAAFIASVLGFLDAQSGTPTE